MFVFCCFFILESIATIRCLEFCPSIKLQNGSVDLAYVTRASDLKKRRKKKRCVVNVWDVNFWVNCSFKLQLHLLRVENCRI